MHTLIINIWGKIYPVIGFSMIEVSQQIETIENLSAISTQFFQWLIAGLTIFKLVKDLKKKK